ncbi:dnaJ homolog subfamily C member 14-like [Vitis riparia]|uniref:dnaJ homolog subfamily C member 14-like n=1 Tax=Vitis riparia TaxID=96939 RepID=UPI00155AA9AB|nr:dnaJ homolog subfamily C member 14-like [Vitis riparia]
MGLGQHVGSIKQKNKQPPPLDIFTRSRSKDANTLQGGHPQPFRALSNRSNDQQPAPSTRDPQHGQACKSREQQPHHHRGIPEKKISKHLIVVQEFENIDVSLLKREYRKKAMLVHPDKNMGNEKAAEAFKKLQNAYEVLLDSLKRKAYDDELRRKELLNCFRRFQTASQKNGRHGPFTSGFPRSEAEVEDPFGGSRRIACKKCGNFHVWVHTKKSKSRARWSQDCKDFHQAKYWRSQCFHKNKGRTRGI